MYGIFCSFRNESICCNGNEQSFVLLVLAMSWHEETNNIKRRGMQLCCCCPWTKSRNSTTSPFFSTLTSRLLFFYFFLLTRTCWKWDAMRFSFLSGSWCWKNWLSTPPLTKYTATSSSLHRYRFFFENTINPLFAVVWIKIGWACQTLYSVT